MIQRIVNPLKTRSFFLFGPRGAGKTTALQTLFGPKGAIYINLLDLETQDQLLLDPTRFLGMIGGPQERLKPVIIDEIQKFPRLLDYVHSEIQKSKRIFIMTGSSSRRLKQKGVNFLAGRASVYHLYPFTALEIGDSFDLKRALERGGLPEAYLASTDEEFREFLSAYVGTYLQKEIQEEQWVRNLAPFRKFLQVSAQMNGKIINKSRIAQEVGVDDVTVANYFEILEDTILGFYLPAFDRSLRKSQKKAPKFYLIDPGVKRALDRSLSVPLISETSAFGEAFEHWIVLEIHKMISYLRLDWEMSYLRTKDDLEIDLVIKRPGLPLLEIEIKSKKQVRESDAKVLETLGRDLDLGAERILISQDSLERRLGSTWALPWQKALKEIFRSV